MGNKTARIKMDINNLFRLIEEVISNSRSKIARENGFGIALGMELLSSYLRQIAERAVELNDSELIDLLLDMHVLKENNEKDDVFQFMKAQQEAEEEGKDEFACPICGGKAWWGRSEINGHLHCGCEGCGKMMCE